MTVEVARGISKKISLLACDGTEVLIQPIRMPRTKAVKTEAPWFFARDTRE